MRLYTIVVSIVAHVAFLVVLVIVPLYAMDALPGARRVTAFIAASPAEVPDPPPPPRGSSAARTTDAVARDAAPVQPPDRIGDEIAAPPGGPGVSDGAPGGVPGGDPNGIRLPEIDRPDPPPPLVPRTYRPGGDIRRPEKIKDVVPVYPEMARSVRVSGTVILEAEIAESGRVRNVRVLRSIPLLDQAALDAVRQWIFTPTLLNGEPVPVVMTVTVTFKLS
jgi:protein TonB